jgi:hypothetical protein
MKSVWMVFPSCNVDRAKHTVSLWRARGYQTLCIGNRDTPLVPADVMVRCQTYSGYWAEANKAILLVAKEASAVVLAADDLEPDPYAKPEVVAEEVQAHFASSGGYGVMQPVGDDMDGMDGVWRICGSPWFTPQWITEAYEGLGPCPYVGFYRAFYGDEELFNVAKAQGVLWQRTDLAQKHNHWCRRGGPKRTDYQARNSDEHWNTDKAFFMDRMAKGFPGSARKA